MTLSLPDTVRTSLHWFRTCSKPFCTSLTWKLAAELEVDTNFLFRKSRTPSPSTQTGCDTAVLGIRGEFPKQWSQHSTIRHCTQNQQFFSARLYVPFVFRTGNEGIVGICKCVVCQAWHAMTSGLAEQRLIFVVPFLRPEPHVKPKNGRLRKRTLVRLLAAWMPESRLVESYTTASCQITWRIWS